MTVTPVVGAHQRIVHIAAFNDLSETAVEIDGVQYYKLTKKDVSYTFTGNEYKATIYAYSKEDSRMEYAESLTLSVASYVSAILEGDFAEQDKQNVKDFVLVASRAYASVGAAFPESLKKYLED